MTKYTVVKIPENLVNEVDRFVGRFGFTSRAEFVKEAVRRLLTELPKKA